MMCVATLTAAGRLPSHRSLECRKGLDGLTVEVLPPSSERLGNMRSLQPLEELLFVTFTRCNLVTCRPCSRASKVQMRRSRRSSCPLLQSPHLGLAFPALQCRRGATGKCRRFGCGMRAHSESWK
jgi:hypothetical protein